jgi:tRNA threonylcarbamoyladenosine biosynthesis protein TsaE
MRVSSQKDLSDAAGDIISRVRETERTGAAVLALTGDLGAGKTTFVKELASELGVEDPVTSPTFVIEQIYDLSACGNAQAGLPPDAAFDRLVHIDAYRLESLPAAPDGTVQAGGEELRTLGWDELVADPANLVVVEWAEKVKDVIPRDAIWLRCEVVGEEERDIVVSSS